MDRQGQIDEFLLKVHQLALARLRAKPELMRDVAAHRRLGARLNVEAAES